jgi:hypothetical protein
MAMETSPAAVMLAMVMLVVALLAVESTTPPCSSRETPTPSRSSDETSTLS